MTSEEQKALDILRENIREKKMALYAMLREIDRSSERELEAMGYRGKTQGEAMQLVFRRFKGEIDSLEKRFLQKFPD